VVIAFEMGDTKGGRGGLALGSVELEIGGEWVEDDRVKKDERRLT
jgi:hypothetical protein